MVKREKLPVIKYIKTRDIIYNMLTIANSAI